MKSVKQSQGDLCSCFVMTFVSGFDLNQYGSFPLSAVGASDVTIISINWASDTIIITSEKETISPLTLAAIIVGAIAVAFDLLFRNWLLITYCLWIYNMFVKLKAPEKAGEAMVCAPTRNPCVVSKNAFVRLTPTPVARVSSPNQASCHYKKRSLSFSNP